MMIRSLDGRGTQPLRLNVCVGGELSYSWLIGLLLSLTLISCQTQTVGEPVTITQVLSGQTVKAQWQGETVTLRLAGIDAPDRQQVPWGEQARIELTQKLATDSELRFEPERRERDRYGRQWGYLWQDDQLINEWLVAQGYGLVKANSAAPYQNRLSHAQDYARIMGLGIWLPQAPMRQTPQTFRAQTVQPAN